MSKPLVIVESPTKVRTIKKYLGNNYNVAATVGHIKDLPAKDLGIDIEHDFTPQYRTIPGKTKVLSQLKSAANDATDIYLAPDPDREGEAIAWHTADVLKKKGRRFHRVLFHELTKNAIIEAMQKAQDLNREKYEAQQARRILDRLVGYQISPLLWRKVKGGLSAGRVQSVAVRIIVDRERAIQVFVPVEYWSIDVTVKRPPAAALRGQTGSQGRGGRSRSPTEPPPAPLSRILKTPPSFSIKPSSGPPNAIPCPPSSPASFNRNRSASCTFRPKKP